MLNAYHPANNTPNRAVFFRSLDISRDFDDPSPPPAAAFVVRVNPPRRPLEPPKAAASRRHVFCSLDGTTDCATHSNVLLLLDPTQTTVGVLDADDDDLKKVVFGCRTEETKRDVVVVDANAALVFIVLRTSVEKRGDNSVDNNTLYEWQMKFLCGQFYPQTLLDLF